MAEELQGVKAPTLDQGEFSFDQGKDIPFPHTPSNSLKTEVNPPPKGYTKEARKGQQSDIVAFGEQSDPYFDKLADNVLKRYWSKQNPSNQNPQTTSKSKAA